ncbi:phosphoglycerate mutase family protein [Corynebacterium deserti GIMN1.010]|uniref:Phosphoglycerate mutase family protein n=2 Tax=Corynebacterium TaxID=1716 RepID=A0A0M4CL44_9CORY|nr:histidine phosphatase family protein [Corynebacterium deserti]ALC05460.1 phosphoglycerate mutase family protein [Corynebacterium deserti GIMN1.010]
MNQGVRSANASQKPTTSVVLLIRHGQTPTTGQVLPGRAPGLHLADRGEEQARDVAKRLEGVTLSAVYSSPMERAQETAAPTIAERDLQLQIEPGLVECDFGAWTGEKLSELNKLPEWKDVQHSPSTFRFPDGESFVEMQDRMVETITTIATRHSGEIVAAFSHADTIKAAVAHFVGTPLDSFQKIHIDTASISAVEFNLEHPENSRMVLTNSRTGQLDYFAKDSSSGTSS